MVEGGGRIQWKQILYKSGTLQQVIPTKLRGKDSIYLLSYTSAIFSVVDYAYLSLLDNAPNYPVGWRVRYPKEIDLVLGIFVIQKCNKTWKFLTTLFFGRGTTAGILPTIFMTISISDRNFMLVFLSIWNRANTTLAGIFMILDLWSNPKFFCLKCGANYKLRQMFLPLKKGRMKKKWKKSLISKCVLYLHKGHRQYYK